MPVTGTTWLVGECCAANVSRRIHDAYIHSVKALTRHGVHKFSPRRKRTTRSCTKPRLASILVHCRGVRVRLFSSLPSPEAASYSTRPAFGLAWRSALDAQGPDVVVRDRHFLNTIMECNIQVKDVFTRGGTPRTRLEYTCVLLRA